MLSKVLPEQVGLYDIQSEIQFSMIHLMKQEESARERALCQLTECF